MTIALSAVGGFLLGAALWHLCQPESLRWWARLYVVAVAGVVVDRTPWRWLPRGFVTWYGRQLDTYPWPQR